MSRRPTRFRFLLSAAALIVALGLAANGARAAEARSPTAAASSAGWSGGRGLILTLPAARPREAPHYRAARMPAPDDSPSDEATLRAFLDWETGPAALPPIAGIVYVF